MIYGYARVSSRGQNLSAQIQALTDFGCEKIFKEKVSACDNAKRFQFEKLLHQVESGDTLVVWKLDRLGRSMFELVEIISMLKEKKVHFISLTENINTNSPTGKIMFMFFSMMAEYEMNLKKERAEAGRILARKNGKLGGRPKGLSKKLQNKACDIKKLYLAKDGEQPLYSIREIEKVVGVTRPSIYKCLRYTGVDTNREEIFK
ncbi:recombinase family protein [Dysgonomonas sp. 521]|uniref:recombinase family protein n=1 Tax=Dysgonomonas sp. 521 TaxID=2302932 RepID=UPI0013D124AD|nr:recombinase family protein [Dysgonomonas sp. 521]NDV96096.1 recombinase family protein [Dysgonomonas sp. 521]